MEWIVKLFFKVFLLVLVVYLAFGFVRQLFTPIERPVVMAGPGGPLPDVLPRKGVSAPAAPTERERAAKTESPPAATATAPLPTAATGATAAAAAPVPFLPPPLPLIEPGKPMVEAVHDQIRYRFLDAKVQGNRLTIRLQVLNKGLDRMMEISSFPWSKTLFYNERGEVYVPNQVQIANKRADAGKTHAMLVSGVPAEILLVYSELPMAAGVLAFNQISLMQLDVALFSTEHAYRNWFIDPLAVSRPTFRIIPITEGPVTGVGR